MIRFPQFAFRLPLFAFCFLLSALGCHHDGNSSRKTVFNINLDEGLTSLDPAFCRNQNTIWMDNQLYNGLVQIDDSLRVKPAIAKSWDISPDGLQYTFHLRNDVYFHDDPLFKDGIGRKAVASDFVYSFSRLLDPKIASSGSWIFSDKITTCKDAFAALNDTTFRIQLKQPFPPLLTLLTSQIASVIPHEVAEHYGKDFRNHPIGTGPFKFKYWKEGEVMVFLKNDKYWEKDKDGPLPHLDAMRATFIGDKQTAFMEFVTGKIDFLNDIDGSYRDDILTKSGKVTQKYKGKFVLNTAPYLNTMYLGMLVDTTLPIVRDCPLKMLKIRQAVNYAIDKQKMIKYLRNSMATPGDAGFVPAGMPGFDNKQVKGYSYNPEKARQLLAEAGYPDGKNLPGVVLTTTIGYRDLIEYVQGQLEQVGIHTRIEIVQSASLRELVAKNGVNFFYGSWIADYPDGENYLSLFYSKNKIPWGPNYTGFSNKEFDRLFEQCYHETDDQQRYALYRRMDNIIMQNAPVVILYYDKLVNLYQDNITGISKNPLNLLVLKRIVKK